MPPPPADIHACFLHSVPQPAQPPRTRRQAFDLIAALKESETRKSQCGLRLIAFYQPYAGGQHGAQ